MALRENNKISYDMDTAMAAHCLLAMSNRPNDHTYYASPYSNNIESRGFCNEVQVKEESCESKQEGTEDEEPSPLRMDFIPVSECVNANLVARILTDLKTIKQENNYQERADQNARSSEESNTGYDDYLEIFPKKKPVPNHDQMIMQGFPTNSIHGRKTHLCLHPGCQNY